MAASTVLDLLTASLTYIGQLGAGQTMNAEDQANGFRHLNLLMGKYSAKRLLIPYVATRSYVLSPSIADYTIGPTGATFTAPRPTFIESGGVYVLGTSVRLPLNILDKPQWDAIVNRNAIADVPESVYPEYTFPNIGIHVNPKPAGAVTLELGAWEQLPRFTTYFDPITLPEEYEEFLEASLAIVWAPDYDQPISGDMRARQADAQQAVMEKNAQGIGGSLSAAQKMISPNVGQPIPTGAAAQ